jgi:choline dehydrogenase-like flavoprotein
MSEGWDRSDILVLGGGTAGCVLAARLSENPTTIAIAERMADELAAEEPAG